MRYLLFVVCFSLLASGCSTEPAAPRVLFAHAEPTERNNTVQEEIIYFANDSASLNLSEKTKLARLRPHISINQHRIEIVGHTDSTSHPSYNLALGMRRAQIVADYLELSIWADNLVAVKSAGDSQPVASNQSEEGRQLNRRVEIRISSDSTR